LERELGVRPTLIKGRGGVFEVRRGQELVFSKKEAGRFPAPGEVVRMLGERGEG
jgi:selT/selW/selH-like putative selenoprotein